MTNYEMIKTALEIAKEAHNGQVDKAGVDYIYHPITVALQCNNAKEKVVALLHDVIEDCSDKVSYELLEEKGFDKEVIEALKLVTHVKNPACSNPREEYKAYVKKLKETGNQVAINVKIADLTHNSDTSRMNEKKSPKYDLYLWAIEYLKGE